MGIPIRDDYPIKKSHILAAVAIVSITVGFLSWAKASFEDADSAKHFKSEIRTSVSILDLKMQKYNIQNRVFYIEDRLYDAKRKADIANIDRYERELERSTQDIQTLNGQIDTLIQYQRQIADK